MRSRPRGPIRLSLVLLVSLLVAGCADDPGDDTGSEEPTGTPSASPTGDHSTQDPDPPEQEPEDPEPPETLDFTYGPAGGCEGALLGEGNCVTFQAGPGGPEVDGHWQELDERYWGLQFTTTVDSVSGDSDCYFVAEDETTILGNAHNGGGPCQGRVPDNTAFMFLYSYVDAHQGMTLQFRL